MGTVFSHLAHVPEWFVRGIKIFRDEFILFLTYPF
jgi:hypothetical protein